MLYTFSFILIFFLLRILNSTQNKQIKKNHSVPYIMNFTSFAKSKQTGGKLLYLNLLQKNLYLILSKQEYASYKIMYWQQPICFFVSIYASDSQTFPNFILEFHQQQLKYFFLYIIYERLNYQILINTCFQQKMIFYSLELKGILQSILSEDSDSKEIIQHQEIMSVLLKNLQETQSMKQFTKNLQEQCGLRPKKILKIIEKCLSICKLKTFLGQRLIKQLLLFRIYLVMDIFKRNERKKRKAVAQIFHSFNFHSGQDQDRSMKNLLDKCFKSIEMQVEDMEQILSAVTESEQVQIKKLFKKKIEQKVQEMSNNHDKSIEQQLRDLIFDYQRMPFNSFEIQLQKWLIFSFLQKNYQQAKTFKSKMKIPKLPTSVSQIQSLKLAYQQYLKDFRNNSKDIKEKFENINPQNLYQSIFSIKSKICPINVGQLQRLIHKTKSSEQLIKTKQVILFIGTTGSGKSTAILKFLGYDLNVGVFKDLTTLIPSSELLKQHQTFYTSPEAKSCTRYINAVSIPSKMFPPNTKSSNKQAMLCDSPGFGDSAGVQVDIANGVGMINALHKAKSARIVVILPYESIIAERMAGAYKISEIISSLFSDISQALGSIIILFNKTPQKQIQRLPNKIKNAVDLWRQQLKTEKLFTFLEEIYNQSKEKQNFIDPLNQDFKEILSKILEKPKIVKMKLFQYDFTDETKQKIESFAFVSMDHIIKYCQAKKYQHSSYYFKNFQKLKNILNKNNKLTESGNQIQKYLILHSKKLFNQYELQVNLMIKRPQKKNPNIKVFAQYLTSFYNRFSQFDNLRANIVDPQKLKELITIKQKEILAEHNQETIKKINAHSVLVIKSFSQEFNKQLLNQFLGKLCSISQKYCKNISSNSKDKKYKEVCQTLASLKHLLDIVIILEKYEFNIQQLVLKISNFKLNVQQVINNVSNSLNDHIKEAYQQLAQISISKSIRKLDINRVNQKIKQFNEILSADYLDRIETSKAQKKMNDLLKGIEKQCRRRIRLCQNLNTECFSQNSSLNKHQLSQTLKHIELLMQIGDIKPQLQKQYQEAKLNIQKRLKQSKQQIRQFIAALRGNNIEQLDKNLDSIIQARNAVQNCSQLLGSQNTEFGLIQQEFIGFLKRQAQKIANINCKLHDCLQKFKKIQEAYVKIEKYQRIKLFGDKSMEIINVMREQFFKMSKTPIQQFYLKYLIKIDPKQYTSLSIILDKFQAYCQYLQRLDQLLLVEQYSLKIKPEQQKNEEILRQIYSNIKIDIENFQQFQFPADNAPSYLKQLLKILLSHSENYNCDKYLKGKLDFYIKESINSIDSKLQDIKGHFENDLESLEVNHCKLYCQIQDIYEKRKRPVFGFKEIYKKLQQQSNKKIKDQQTRIISMIKDKKPNQINFDEIKQYYNRYTKFSTAENFKKRRIITNQLEIVEKDIICNLKKYSYQIAEKQMVLQEYDIDNFIQSLQEARQMEQQLRQLYSQQSDIKKISINLNTFTQIKNKIQRVYRNQSQNLTIFLEQFLIGSFNQKIKSYDHIQKNIFQLFQIGKQTASGKQINLFIKNKGNEIKGKIKSMGSLNQEEELSIEKKIKLKDLFLMLRNKIQNYIKISYENIQDTIKLDVNFNKYYQQVQHQKRQQLQRRIQRKFRLFLEDYESKWNSLEQSQAIVKNIEQSLKYLPPKLKDFYKDKFQSLRKNLNSKETQEIKSFYNNFDEAASSIKQLFEKVDELKKLKNASYLKWFNQFKQFYKYSSSAKDRTQQTIKFILRRLIKTLQFEAQYPNLNEFFSFIKLQFQQSLQSLANTANKNFNTLSEFFYKELITQIKQKMQNAVQQIITVGRFIAKIQKCQVNILKGSKIMENIKENMTKIVKIYDLQVEKASNLKGSSQNIFNTNFVDNLKQLRQLKIKIQIINQLSRQLQISSQLKDKINQIPSIYEMISTYKQQIKKMINFLQSYDFFGDSQRNMSDSELQDDLRKLNQYYQILSEREDQLCLEIDVQDYLITQIVDHITKLFERHINQTQYEIEENFRKIYGTVSDRPMILTKQLQILKNIEKTSSKCILSSTDSNYTQIPKLIDKSFQSAINKCEQSLKNLIAINSQRIIQIKNRTKEFEDNIQSLRQKNKQNLQFSIEQLSKKLKNFVEIDPQNKNQYQRSFQSERQSLRKQFKDELQEQIKDLQEDYQDQVRIIQDERIYQANKFTFQLIILKKNLIDYPRFKKFQKEFNRILTSMYNEKKEYLLIELVEKSLSEDRSDDQRAIGKQILIKEKVFSSFAIKRINNSIQSQDIDYVIANLKKIGTKLSNFQEAQLHEIKDLFNTFNKQYQGFKNSYKQHPTLNTINNLVQKIKDLGKKIKEQFYQNQRPEKQLKAKIILLSGILALWAILRSQKGQQRNVEFTVEPHPTQVTAMILLLGFSDSQQSISNSFAQVGTGEGKSIILAGLSCYLALVGFFVRCACYSSYLSSRDSENFKELFNKLGIQNNIKYGTFNQICEDVLNNNGTNLAQQIKKMILKAPSTIYEKIISSFFGSNSISSISSFSFKRKKKQDPTILIVDEVDAFYEDSFFGNTYCPAISLGGKNVKNLLYFVWKQVQKYGYQTKYQYIKKSNQFQALAKQYPSLRQLLKNHISGMIAGALNYKHDYHITNNKIVYKDGDFISTKMSYGYKTIFANIYQFQRRRVSASNLEESLKLNLMVAEFSYALLPKYFANILGVAGILQFLPLEKKKLLQEQYKINHQYGIPSPFGLNNKRIIKYFFANQATFYRLIIERIQQVKDNRPILIFFKGINQLDQFATCPEFSHLTHRSSSISQKHQEDMRNSRIIRAVNAGNITLVTSAFCRGTDFMIVDDKVNQNGGLHVIQTFLSLQEAEEIQTKGRTARQSSPGSYDCIINQNCLEQLDLKSNQFPQSASQIHAMLKGAREKRSNKLSQNTRKMFENANKKHHNAQNIFEKPNLSQIELINYVESLNKYPEIKCKTIKTILALDATGSMASALSKTCQIIGNTFERTFQVLKSKSVQAAIEIKIIVYRNYNSSYDQILQGTAFQNVAHNLRVFLSKVKPKGGWGNQALQVLFQSLNRQTKVDQVILIGDAAPNTPQEVRQKRSAKKGKIDGQQYWKKNGFPLTYFQNEFNLFTKKHKDCPVHSFYLYRAQAFKSISQRTNGQAKIFEINSPKVTENLQAFVVENILKIIERQEGSSLDLVDEYRKMYLQK